MPCYEYRCASNGRTLEVRHGMDERIGTWGELARRAGAATGDTPADAPVERLMSAPVPHRGAGADSGTGFQGCGSGCACVPPG
jgi:predicted nucleic acid-binding Zn ribbon protein